MAESVDTATLTACVASRPGPEGREGRGLPPGPRRDSDREKIMNEWMDENRNGLLMKRPGNLAPLGVLRQAN